MKYIFILVLLLTFGLTYGQDGSLTDDQMTNDEREKMIIYELQDFRYNFFKGDTLRYSVASFDSIIINYGKPLEKTRFEQIEVTCDSVSKDRKFMLGFRLLKLISDESFDKEENVRRLTSPWVGRKTYLWIDSLGNRIKSYPDDTLKLAISPGGAFAPYLFFPIKETYRYINESWIVNSNDTIYENGVPASVLKQSSLFRARKPIDTLGYESSRFSFIKTAIGAVNVITSEQILRTEATISGSGFMTMSKKEHFPVHYFANIEQKLMIFYPEQDALPGQHYISTDWTLDTFIPSKLRYAPENGSKSKKKKK